VRSGEVVLNIESPVGFNGKARNREFGKKGSD